MKLKSILGSIAYAVVPKLKQRKREAMERCGCPCHAQGVVISHFVPCCKYTDQKIKR